jgi:DNA-binding MarR family transcriptional regulator
VQGVKREHLLTELELLFREMSKKFRNGMNSAFNGEITVSEFFFLKYLLEAGPLKPSDVASQFGVSLSHVTALSDRMIKKGLIHRTRSEEDRRIVELVLSDKAKQTLEKLVNIKRQYVETVFQKVTDEELSQLIRIYQKMR